MIHANMSPASWQGTQYMPFAGPRRRVDDASMRFIYVAAAVTTAVLSAVVPAHADTHGYLRCIKSDAQIPPGNDARQWLPGVAFIETELNSGKSRAHVTQELVGAGVTPDDAAPRVDCVMANWPIGTS